MKKIKHLLALLAITLFSTVIFTYCSDDDEIVVPKTEVTEENDRTTEEEEPLIGEETLLINNFIKENMEIYYFWNEEMPDIDQEQEENPSDYFYKLLKDPDDKWSFITDDYQALVNYFAGVQKSTGYSLMPIYAHETGNKVIAYIEYVHPDTPAEKAGLNRGDMIYKIDGQEMDDQNYSELLSRDIFEITLGEYSNDGSIIEKDPTIQMESIEIDLNPIVKTNVIDTLGHKIGYLAYTSFVYDYNEKLEAVIEGFKQKQVTELILDLRYNGGGSVASAQLLGNMLVPPVNEGNVFIETVYNDIITNDINNDPDYGPEFFIRRFEAHASNLNINTLHVLTTGSTASASEMVIYGLDPYMDVVRIGTQTHGKYYGSITISDEEKHNWAIQPLVLRSINAQDNIDYTQGLKPNPENELRDIFYLFPYDLGHPKELFMAKAISTITGEPFIYEEEMDQLKSAGTSVNKNAVLKQKLYPNRSKMYITPNELPARN